MKKIALLLIVALLFLLSASSCSGGKPVSADDLVDKIEVAMDKLKSLRQDMTTSFTYKLNGETVTGSVSGYAVFTGMRNDKFSMYETSTAVVTVAEEVITNKSTIAYSDGKMYISNRSEDDSSKLCSKISKDEFLEYRSMLGENIFHFFGGSKKTYEKQGRSGWSAEFSGFEKDEAVSIADKIGMNAIMYNDPVSDVRIEILADSKFRLKEIEITVISESSTALFTTKIEYSDFNKTKKKDFNTSGYTEVDDAGVANLLSKAINDKMSNITGSLTYTNFQKVVKRDDRDNIDTVLEETGTANYQIYGRAISYNIKSKVGSQNVQLDYMLGTQAITVGGKTVRQDMDPFGAYAILNSLICGGEYQAEYVKDVEKISDGVFKLQLEQSDIDEIKDLVDGYESYTWYVTATFNGAEIEKIEEYIEVTGAQYCYVIERSVAFD